MSQYFIYNNPFVAGTVARAEEVNDKFVAVETSFDAVKVDIDERITLSGDDVITGAKDFTGATLLVAVPVASASPVTKLYADTLAFLAGDIPAQLGNEGKLINTDGTNIFWANLDAGTF